MAVYLSVKEKTEFTCFLVAVYDSHQTCFENADSFVYFSYMKFLQTKVWVLRDSDWFIPVECLSQRFIKIPKSLFRCM